MGFGYFMDGLLVLVNYLKFWGDKLGGGVIRCKIVVFKGCFFEGCGRSNMIIMNNNDNCYY